MTTECATRRQSWSLNRDGGGRDVLVLGTAGARLSGADRDSGGDDVDLSTSGRVHGRIDGGGTRAGGGGFVNFNGDAFLDMVIVTASKADVLVRTEQWRWDVRRPFSVVGTSALAKLADPRSLAVPI